MRRPLRIALIAVAVIVVVVAGAAGVAALVVDPNSFKPQIEAAVKRATGRTLALNGKLGLAFSLIPTITVQDAVLANPPGFSRPEMATLRSMDARIALLPLLSRRIEIDSLVLRRPDILLETNARGEPNWKFTPQAAPNGQAEAPGGRPASRGMAVGIAALRIQDGTIAYRDDRTGEAATLGIGSLTARAASAAAPLHLAAEATYDGHPFRVEGDAGSLARLQDAAATTPWPVRLGLAAAGASLTVEGSLTHPLEGKGYSLSVAAQAPDLQALAAYVPAVRLPALHDVRLQARLADKGAALPDVSGLVLHVGASDLGAQVPGLTVGSLDVAAPAIAQPVKVAASGTLRGTGFSVAGTLGPPAAFLPAGVPVPFPLALSAQAAGAKLAASGTVADMRALSGVAVRLNATIPDLAALAPLLGRPLPAVTAIALRGMLADAAGGLREGVALHGLTLSTADGDMAGEAALTLAPRPALDATLAAQRIDADAFEAALDKEPKPPAGATPGAPAPVAAPPKPAPGQGQGQGRLFSDHPLHLDHLREADADVTLRIGDLRAGRADYRAISTHAVLKGGTLSVDPFSAELPAGHMQAVLSADASRAVPAEHLTLHAPGLALKTILTLLHQPSYASGSLEVLADLTAAGDSAHAIAASLGGHAGLAMQGGTIDNRLLGSMLGKVMNTLEALPVVGKGSSGDLRCFAARMDAHDGDVRLDPLALSSTLLTMTGTGSVNLGAETVSLQLRPQARVAGTGLVIPLTISGPIRNPAVGVNRVGAAESNAGAVAGAVIGDATPLGIVGGLLGANKLVGGSSDICAPALAAARGQAAPKAAAPARSAAPLSDPGQALRNLFR